MTLKELQPYYDICNVAFDFSRLRRSARQRATVHGADLDAGNCDAFHALAELMHSASEKIETDSDSKLLARNVFQYIIVTYQEAINRHRSGVTGGGGLALKNQASDIAKSGAEVFLRYKDNKEVLYRFVRLLLASCLGDGMIKELDIIAWSLRDLGYLSSLQETYSKEAIRFGGPNNSTGFSDDEGEDEGEDEGIETTLGNIGLGPINLPWPFQEGANMVATREIIKFQSPSSQPEQRTNQKGQIVHIISIHYANNPDSVIGVIPENATIDIHQQQSRNSPESPQQEEREVQDDENLDSENRTGHPTVIDTEIPQEVSHSRTTSDDEGTHEHNVRYIPAGNIEIPTVDVRGTNLSRVETGTTHNPSNEREPFTIPSNERASHSTGIRQEPHQEDENISNFDTGILSDQLIQRIINIPIADGRNSEQMDISSMIRDFLPEQPFQISGQEDNTGEENNAPDREEVPLWREQEETNIRISEGVRPWTKLVAVLNPLEPVPIDDALVFTYKTLHRRNGRVKRNGLIPNLKSHETLFHNERMLDRLLKLQYNQAGAHIVLPQIVRGAAIAYMLVTFSLSVTAAAMDVGKRSSWYGRATDFLSLISLFWVSVFGFVKLIVDDPDVLRNLALGLRVFRTSQQIYNYAGDVTVSPSGVVVRTLLARLRGNIPWASSKEMEFARGTLNGNIELRGGLTASQLHHAGWVFGPDVAYDLLKGKSYKTKLMNGRYLIQTEKYYGFPGLKNLVLHHFKPSIFT